MPLLLPKQRGVRRESNFTGRPSLTWGTTVPSHTSAHQYPSTYTQIFASTAFDTDLVNIRFHTNATAATDTDSHVTLYIGAGGSEQVLMEALLAGWAALPGSSAAASCAPKVYSFPLRIPAGSRISARHQSVRTSTNVYVMMELLGGGQGNHWVGTRVEAVGENTATSGGVSVTPGGASEGTFTSIGTNTYDWGYVQPMMGGNLADTTMITGLQAADIGSGASTLIQGLDEFLFETSTGEECGFSFNLGRYCHVPAGTTLYLRSQSDNSVEAKDFCIYGVA